MILRAESRKFSLCSLTHQPQLVTLYPPFAILNQLLLFSRKQRNPYETRNFYLW